MDALEPLSDFAADLLSGFDLIEDVKGAESGEVGPAEASRRLDPQLVTDTPASGDYFVPL